MKQTLIRTLACIAMAAIIAVLGRACNNDDITMPNNPIYPMHVDSTELLTIYDITDCPLDLACGQMPDTAQENVLLCAAAAFTGQCLDHFEHSNILGPHISGGILHEGYIEDKDSILFAERYALFVWEGKGLNGNMLGKRICSFPCEEVLDSAVEHGGMAFTQHWVIKNGEIYAHKIQPLDRVEHFRSICQKGGAILCDSQPRGDGISGLSASAFRCWRGAGAIHGYGGGMESFVLSRRGWQGAYIAPEGA